LQVFPPAAEYLVLMPLLLPMLALFTVSADPCRPWPRRGSAWDHRRCATLAVASPMRAFQASQPGCTISHRLCASGMRPISCRQQR
jgi:hypothetical protein